MKFWTMEMNESIYNHLREWCRLAERQENSEDVWTELESLPGWRFKNLRFVSQNTEEDVGEMTFNFKFDKIEKPEL